MVADPASLTHAAGREYDLRPCVLINGFGILGGDGQGKSIEPNGVDALLYQRQRLCVQTVRTALQKDPRRFYSQRTVYIYREVVMARKP